MNSIEKLQTCIQRDFPEANLTLTAPLLVGGVWSLDVDFNKSKLVIEWSSETGFGISSATADSYGEQPDESFPDCSAAMARVEELLSSGKKTVPPYAFSLGQLRECRGMTQQELAEKLRLKQASVSGMERRGDIQISTLRRTVRALGGDLVVFGVFHDAKYLINTNGEIANQDQFAQYHEVQLAVELHEPLHAARDYSSMFPCLSASGQLSNASAVAVKIKSKNAVFEMTP
jgi:transcriptional regulator with XRE-family HTH domain